MGCLGYIRRPCLSIAASSLLSLPAAASGESGEFKNAEELEKFSEIVLQEQKQDIPTDPSSVRSTFTAAEKYLSTEAIPNSQILEMLDALARSRHTTNSAALKRASSLVEEKLFGYLVRHIWAPKHESRAEMVKMVLLPVIRDEALHHETRWWAIDYVWQLVQTADILTGEIRPDKSLREAFTATFQKEEFAGELKDDLFRVLITAWPELRTKEFLLPLLDSEEMDLRVAAARWLDEIKVDDDVLSLLQRKIREFQKTDDRLLCKIFLIQYAKLSKRTDQARRRRSRQFLKELRTLPQYSPLTKHIDEVLAILKE